MKTPILGSAYVARSVNAADNQMINLFPEVVPEGGKENAFLSRTAGLRLLGTVGTGPIRGLWQHGEYMYVVSGEKFYKVDSSYTSTLIGTVAGTYPVSMADNGGVLFIAATTASYMYLLGGGSGDFQQITSTEFVGASIVQYIDTYFVYLEPNSQRFYSVDSYTLTGDFVWPLVFDATTVASAEGSPDNLTGMIVDHGEIWLFGENSTEVWYNAGNPEGSPFSRIQGAFNEIGCAAEFSVAKMDNQIFWLGKDARGKGIVYRAEGYSGKRVSTHAIEFAISQYDTIDDAIAYTYQQEGHTFYVLTFPSADATWVYDAATGAWHQRAAWYNGAFKRHRSNCQVTYKGEVVVGDYENGKIYAFDMDVYDDAGQTQRWLRSWRALPTGQNELVRTAHHSLQLDCESGVGLNEGQGDDPQVMLRWSDDGGHTWSYEHWAPMGKIGQYYRRVFWRRLGMTLKLRDRVYELSGTDPVKVIIMGAELHASGTSA